MYLSTSSNTLCNDYVVGGNIIAVTFVVALLLLVVLL